MFLAVSLTAAFLFSSCESKKCDCDEAELPVVGAPKNIISVNDADFLFKNYKNGNAPILEEAYLADSSFIEEPKNKVATRSLFIPYKELKLYLAYIESVSDTAAVDITGIRIYLGQYAKNGKFPDGKPSKYKGVGTVFLNPTAKFKNSSTPNEDVSFALIDSAGTKVAVPVGQLIAGSELIEGLRGGDTTSLSFNEMQRSPPPNSNPNDFH